MQDNQLSNIQQEFLDDLVSVDTLDGMQTGVVLNDKGHILTTSWRAITDGVCVDVKYADRSSARPQVLSHNNKVAILEGQRKARREHCFGPHVALGSEVYVLGASDTEGGPSFNHGIVTKLMVNKYVISGSVPPSCIGVLHSSAWGA